MSAQEGNKDSKDSKHVFNDSSDALFSTSCINTQESINAVEVFKVNNSSNSAGRGRDLGFFETDNDN